MSHRSGWLAAFPLALALAFTGCIAADVAWSDGGGSSSAAMRGYSDDRTKIEIVSTNVGGKNVFIPSTWVLTEGEGRVLSFYNTTDTPHGMSIHALDVSEILMPGEEHVLELPPLEAGHVYQVHCHLHPPHRGASLVVLPGR